MAGLGDSLGRGGHGEDIGLEERRRKAAVERGSLAEERRLLTISWLRVIFEVISSCMKPIARGITHK